MLFMRFEQLFIVFFTNAQYMFASFWGSFIQVLPT